MYYVFQSAIIGWRNSYIQAVPQKTFSWETFRRWQFSDTGKLDHWADELDVFQFEVKPKAPHPDNYWTGAEIDLYSIKLISLLETLDVRFETFEAALLDRTSKQVLPLNYRVFRLLEMDRAIDDQESEIGIGKYRNLRIRRDFSSFDRLLFRDRTLQELVLAHEALKVKLEDAGVTGCKFTPLQEFQVGFEV